MKIAVKGIGEWHPAQYCIAVVLTEQDKQNIANMHPDATIYCEFERDGGDHASAEQVSEINAWLDALKREQVIG